MCWSFVRDVILCDNLIIVPLIRKIMEIDVITLGNILLMGIKSTNVIYTPAAGRDYLFLSFP